MDTLYETYLNLDCEGLEWPCDRPSDEETDQLNDKPETNDANNAEGGETRPGPAASGKDGKNVPSKSTDSSAGAVTDNAESAAFAQFPSILLFLLIFFALIKK